MRSHFDKQLEALNKEVITMGMLCEAAIDKASQALLGCDAALAGELPELLEQVNQKERQIEGVCLRLLLQQQPVARDLRTVSAALKLVTDVERIADQSADIGEILALGNVRRLPEQVPLKDMTAAVTKMVTESIDAFVKQDRKIACAVIKYDDVVDGYFNTAKSALIEALKQPDADAEASVDLLMISKYFERIADHAVNIAKWVSFSITGELVSEETSALGALSDGPRPSEK
ncbi:MAG: phosphate signaling complex protein PhoU [Oscillospiraceae bacterium]|nr:phosphate signaling complex protein PhoU [Oscillospiraceae bacterium]